MEGPPTLHMDYIRTYSFIKSAQWGDAAVTILLAVWRGQGIAFANVVTKRGRGDRHVVLALHRWLRGNGLNSQIRIRTDRESSIRSLAAELVAVRHPAVTILELTAVGSSSSSWGCGATQSNRERHGQDAEVAARVRGSLEDDRQGPVGDPAVDGEARGLPLQSLQPSARRTHAI